MKKLMTAALVLLAATTLLSAAPKSGKKGPKIQKKDPITIFDPATLTAAPAGCEIVEKDGAKYLKISCEDWNNYFDAPAVELKGYNRFCCTMYADAENENYSYVVQIQDANDACIATLAIKPLGSEPTLVRVGHDEKQSWNTISKTDKAEKYKAYVQDANNGWNPANEKVNIYIGKIYAE